MFAFPLCAQTSGSGPGATDPAGNPRNLTLFRDEQIYNMGLPSATGNPWRAATLSFDANLKPTSSVAPLPWSSDVPLQEINAQSVAGRIVHPDKDDIVVVQRSGTDNTKLAVRFRDGSGATMLGNLPQRSTGYTDFFATSVGDLDQLYDSQGNYHDEVVVAWMEPGSVFNAPSGCLSVNIPFSAVPHVAVLNYNSGVNPSVLAQTINRDDNQYLPYCILDSYNQQENLARPTVPGWAPMPGDNIMATAIGDFDGDGHNEVAVAYMRGTAGLVVSVVIYRYQNDGTTTSLTPVNNYEFSLPNSSMVATLSLAAGNFDGSGVDQLFVGTAGWWGTISNGEYQTGTFKSKPMAFLLTAGQAQGSITGASANPNDSTKTDFTVNLGSGVYVPQTVTIAGAIGLWAPINGTWTVTPSATGTGFTLDMDSSVFESFAGQNVTVTTAAPLTQADSISLEPIPGTTAGEIEVDDLDVDAYIRVQAVPGLFHYDPNNGYDVRRRQIAMAWNARAAVRYTDLTQNGDTHLALLQITPDDKIQVAATQNLLIGNWQLFQGLSMTAGAMIGDNTTNDPTWSLYFSGYGSEFDHNQPFGSRNVYTGMVAGVWKVSLVDGDATKLNPAFVCSDKATSDTYSPTYQGAPEPVCPIWVDAETTVQPPPTSRSKNLNYLRLPAVAADLNGNSLKLGAPVHLQLINPGKAHYILEQPPQHAAYLDLGEGPQVVTISRFPSDFATTMKNSTTDVLATKTKNHTDWNVGASESASATFTANLGDMKAVGAQIQTSYSEKVGYDYNKVHNDYAAGSQTYEVGESAQTGTDDYLEVEAQILDIWRYRIFGAGAQTGDPQNPNAFYQIVLPGPPSLILTPGGVDVDWYQPVHEVGNILSYPQYDEVCNPSDLGPFTRPDPNNPGKTITAATPLIACSQLYYDGNSTTRSLKLDQQNSSGLSDDFTHKIQADINFGITFKQSFMTPGIGGETSAFKANVDVHGGGSWGQLTTDDNSTTDATGITIMAQQGDSNHAYPFYPILYNSTAGGLKVSYAVGQITESEDGNAGGGEFWTNNYAQNPDPALNLPHRFNATYTKSNKVNGWAPETTILRKRMKGFVVRKPDIDPITGYYPLLGSNPQDGDKVLLEARVYNYSISETPASFTVQFSVIPYDGHLNNEICDDIPTTGKGGRVCPASARTVIGIGTTQPAGGTSNFVLNGRENAKAYLVWNTSGFGPAAVGANDYRVYVDLVSNTDELYRPEPACTALPCEDNFSNETIVDPGQNNEGWDYISVAKPLLGGPSGGSNSAEATHGSLGTEPASGNAPQAFESTAEAANRGKSGKSRPPKPLVAYLRQPLPLRLTAFSSAVSNLHGYVSIFDGTPGASNTATIAMNTVHGVTPDGTSTWFTWTPREKGLHHLYAVIQNTTGTTPLGDVVVKVRRAPGDLNEDGRVDRHDLNMLNRDLKKPVTASACGEECDLDGDGKITQKDADLMAQLCDSQSCAFEHIEYVGGASPDEPDMRMVRKADDTARANFVAAHADDKETVSNADQVATAQLFQTELQRKQGLRSIQYWYKGKTVTAGPYAQPATAIAKR